jgi:hypothetical protein
LTTSPPLSKTTVTTCSSTTKQNGIVIRCARRVG